MTKAELLDLAWPGLIVEENNLQVQISTLRKLLGTPAIATIPGRGYRLCAPLAMAGGDLRLPEPTTISLIAFGPRATWTMRRRYFVM